jgi:predicted RNA-binding protein with TRAM domain
MYNEGRERRGFDSGRGMRYAPKPVEVGKEYDVEIQELSRRGEGVARIQGLVTFIPNTKVGDHVKIKIIKVGSRFAEAEVAGTSETKTETE